MPGTDQIDDDKRIARRLRVLKQGKIVLPNGLTILDCAVRDLSETGARLICGETTAIPNTFRLAFPADRTIRDAKVVWRRPDQVGVHFTSAAAKAPLLKW